MSYLEKYTRQISSVMDSHTDSFSNTAPSLNLTEIHGVLEYIL